MEWGAAAMLELVGVSKSYDKGATWAVGNLNLHVRQGEIFGFLGPNGAGKTTTLKMVAGLLPPDKGTRYLGNPVAPVPSGLGLQGYRGFPPRKRWKSPAKT